MWTTVRRVSLSTCVTGLLVLTVLNAPVRADDSPLERLQKRSADQRWREARQQWVPGRLLGNPPKKQRTPDSPAESNRPSSIPSSTAPVNSEPVKSGSATSERENASPAHSSQPESASPANEQQGAAVPELTQPQLPVVIDILAEPLFGPHSIPSEAAQRPAPATPIRESIVPEPVLTSPGSSAPRLSFLPPEPEGGNGVQRPGLIRRGELEIPARPLLKSIREIQPFHDYSTRPAERQPAPGLARFTPQLETLPPQGELTRNMPPTYYHWMASNLKHDPLYFEDVALERYGHTYPDCVQPFVSVGKFGLQVVGLPYLVALDPVWCEEYALGYYRPGDCAPHLCYVPPFNKEAALTSAGIYTGLFFLFP